MLITELLTSDEQAELVGLCCCGIKTGIRPSANATTPMSRESAVTAGPEREALRKSGAKIPKSLEPLPTSVLSPINKNPTGAEKKALLKKTDLIHSIKTGQMSRLMR